VQLGETIAKRRRELKLSQTSVASAAHVARATVARIESGSQGVTIGGYAGVMGVLGLSLCTLVSPRAPSERDQPALTPFNIDVAKYPQLRALLWSVPDRQGGVRLTGIEALNVYERNWRHVDQAAMSSEERALVASLVEKFGNGVFLV